MPAFFAVTGRVKGSDATDILLGDAIGDCDPFPTSAGQLSVVSSSPNDTAGGSGAREVLIQAIYENPPGAETTDFVVLTQTLPLNGTTPVDGFVFGTVVDGETLTGLPIGTILSGTGTRRARSFRTGESGVPAADPPGGTPEGTITLTIGSNTITRILPGRSKSEVAFWSTGGTRLEFLLGLAGSFSKQGGGMGGDLAAQFWTREWLRDYGWQPQVELTGNKDSTQASVTLAEPLPFPLMTDVEVIVVNGGQVAADLAVLFLIKFDEGF